MMRTQHVEQYITQQIITETFIHEYKHSLSNKFNPTYLCKMAMH